MKERVLQLLQENMPQIDFTATDELIDSGVLDSLLIVNLLSLLSMEFNVMFDINELVPDNLNSIDAIVETIQKLQNK